MSGAQGIESASEKRREASATTTTITHSNAVLRSSTPRRPIADKYKHINPWTQWQSILCLRLGRRDAGSAPVRSDTAYFGPLSTAVSLIFSAALAQPRSSGRRPHRILLVGPDPPPAATPARCTRAGSAQGRRRLSSKG